MVNIFKLIQKENQRIVSLTYLVLMTQLNNYQQIADVVLSHISPSLNYWNIFKQFPNNIIVSPIISLFFLLGFNQQPQLLNFRYICFLQMGGSSQ